MMHKTTAPQAPAIQRAKPGEASVHLTQEVVRGFPLPPAKNAAGKPSGSRIYMDDSVPGFCCQVSYAGTKTFRLRYRKGAKWYSVKIGRWRDGAERKQPGKVVPEKRALLTAGEARIEAEALRALLNKGGNPASERKIKAAEREAMAAGLVTVKDAYDRYLDSISNRMTPLRPGSVVQIKSAFKNHILPKLGESYVSAITKEDVSSLVVSIARVRTVKGRKLGGKSAANHVFRHLSTFLSWCVAQAPALAAENVAKKFDKNAKKQILAPEEKRRRYLTPDEWGAVMHALDEWPFEAKRGSRFAQTKVVRLDKPQARQLVSCEALRVALLTGARKGEVLAMRWADIDLDRGWWEKPAETMKTKKAHRVSLSGLAIESLRRVRHAHADGIWVFPGKERLDKLGKGRRLKDDEGGPAQDVHELWGKIREKLGIPDVRIHDLRHTAASVLVSTGATLAEVGDQLGHSQAQTTMRYAHLFDEAKRANAKRMDAFGAAHLKKSG